MILTDEGVRLSFGFRLRPLRGEMLFCFTVDHAFLLVVYLDLLRSFNMSSSSHPSYNRCNFYTTGPAMDSMHMLLSVCISGARLCWTAEQ